MTGIRRRDRDGVHVGRLAVGRHDQVDDVVGADGERRRSAGVTSLKDTGGDAVAAQERAELMDKLGLAAQNKAALGRVLGTGNIAEATERADGRMEATIRIRPDEIAWDPSILVMPQNLTFIATKIAHGRRRTGPPPVRR